MSWCTNPHLQVPGAGTSPEDRHGTITKRGDKTLFLQTTETCQVNIIIHLVIYLDHLLLSIDQTLSAPVSRSLRHYISADTEKLNLTMLCLMPGEV